LQITFALYVSAIIINTIKKRYLLQRIMFC